MKGISCLWVHNSIKSQNVFSHCSNAPATELHIEFRSSLQGGKIKSISTPFRLCIGMFLSGIIFSLDLASYSSWKCFISEHHINRYQYIIKIITLFHNFKWYLCALVFKKVLYLFFISFFLSTHNSRNLQSTEICPLYS